MGTTVRRRTGRRRDDDDDDGATPSTTTGVERARGGATAQRDRMSRRSVVVRMVRWFVVMWAIVLTWGEYVEHARAQKQCSWPEMAHSTRVMVIADPQLVDEYTYKALKKDSLSLAFVEAICDAYVRRAFVAAKKRFAPDHYVFLGDLFGQGARRDGPDWDRNRARVDAVFDWTRDGVVSTNANYHTIPGNHDIGYSEVVRNHPRILDRHEEWYGASNYVERIGGVDFVGINAMVLDGHGESANATWAFIDTLGSGKGKPSPPRVLLTHLPLPNPSQQCGPNRNSGVIPGRYRGRPKEVVYQDYLTKESANRMLTAIKPHLILSGHDHDQCEVTHKVASQDGETDVTEITVGTFSALNGNTEPSYLMLSVSNDAGANSDRRLEDLIKYKLCFLPNIREVVRKYIYMFSFCILACLAQPFGELIKPSVEAHNVRLVILRLRYV